MSLAGPQLHWLLEKEGMYGAVQCLDNYDITGDGVKDLIVGKHDGSIEVYSYEDGEECEPMLRFSHVSLQRSSAFKTRPDQPFCQYEFLT